MRTTRKKIYTKKNGQIRLDPHEKLVTVECELDDLRRTPYGKRSGAHLRKMGILSSYRARLCDRILTGTWK